MNALVAGNGSYIVRPCGHDLHGPTVSIHWKKCYMVIKDNMCVAKDVLLEIFDANCCTVQIRGLFESRDHCSSSLESAISCKLGAWILS